MGNIGSQTGHISQRIPTEEKWAHSFPRTQPPRVNYQHKVLPDRDARQKLRSTNNGEILHSGGTLSGRQHRPPTDQNNSAHGYKEQSPPSRSYYSNERDPLHKSRPQALHRHNQNVASQKAILQQMKSFASEPDLRYTSPIIQDIREKKKKKKYKAPSPPQNYQVNYKVEWEENSSDTDFPTRKQRLFKTRAETKKTSSHVNKYSSMEYNENLNNPENVPNLRPNRLSLPELKVATSDEFQRELKEATKRLRHIQAETKNTITYEISETRRYNTNNEKLKTLDHNVNNVENVRKKLKEMEIDDNKNIIINSVRGEASGKESSTPDNSPNLISKDLSSRDHPNKTFYFGMDEPPSNNDIVDNFTTNLHQINKISNSSESDISSDIDSEENQVSKIGINLQLRPILPKKQLEIPRFSPAVAWRLLSSMEIDAIATTANDDVPVFVEERIEKYSRPPPPSVQVGPRSSNDKSGDSGISGDDAIPAACYDDNTETRVIIPGPTTSYVTKQERISWTPQQDLGDDSSMEECINNKSILHNSKSTHSGPHLFSLSLPRDNQLAAYMIEKSNPHYSGLERLKRSVTGVLNNLSNKKDIVQANLTDEESVNWFLSKSAPNSLSNGFHSLEVRKSQDSDQAYPSGVNKTSRVMYLPETEANQSRSKTDKTKIRSTDNFGKFQLSVYSKSCEDITTEVIEQPPEVLQEPPARGEKCRWKSTKKSKKFTFQSTIRQIEKKRLSDKLSREAERREKKRLRELEAMQKVEEEFQKKRAREKATIRQQLRLYCMDEDPVWSSLPPNLEIKHEASEYANLFQVRPEPDGAISSSAASSPLSTTKSNDKNHFQKHKSLEMKNVEGKAKPPATQELSEYRQTQRDYKDYRGGMKYTSDGRYPKHTTVHPQITRNMPKAKGTTVGAGNYRKDFAYGVKGAISGGSTYSEDSQNNSQAYHNKFAPITRF